MLRHTTLTIISSAILVGFAASPLYQSIDTVRAAGLNDSQTQPPHSISYDVLMSSNFASNTSSKNRYESTLEITFSNTRDTLDTFPLRFQLSKGMQVLSYQFDQEPEQKLQPGVFAQREFVMKIRDIPAQGRRQLKLKLEHLVGEGEKYLDLPITLLRSARSVEILANSTMKAQLTSSSTCPPLSTGTLQLNGTSVGESCSYLLSKAILQAQNELKLSLQHSDTIQVTSGSLQRPSAPTVVFSEAELRKHDTVATLSPKTEMAATNIQVTGSAIRDREIPIRHAMPMAPIEIKKSIAARTDYQPQYATTLEQNTAKYQQYNENPWKRVAEEPVSTFSADVDTASYANVRRFLQRGNLPAPDAVRAEELINYFGYDYALPAANAKHPFSVRTDLSASPWNKDRYLLRVAIKGKDLAKETLPPANLVFLVDVSGSMSPIDRLPLVKSALKLLTAQLREQDHVSLVTYASGSRVVLPPTSGSEKNKIMLAIDQLVAGGGTNGETGLRLAYRQAHVGVVEGGINRVLLATDGDLNIGITDPATLKALVENERKSGISLSTLGVGDSNYNDALMKKLADNGDGSYHYLDSLQEAHKVLVNEYTSSLATIAQDLKLQVEFNPSNVAEYRLIGYELRALTREQFNDDKVDAGDIGAGHSVTALYEIVPAGGKANVDSLRYHSEKPKLDVSKNSIHQRELALLKLRYKNPGEAKSQLIEIAIDKPSVSKAAVDIAYADPEFRFAAAVAAWAQWLRGSPLIGDYSTKDIVALARSGRGEDKYGHRAEFIRLVELSTTFKPNEAAIASRPFSSD